jgi:hypothetical protein
MKRFLQRPSQLTLHTLMDFRLQPHCIYVEQTVITVNSPAVQGKFSGEEQISWIR